MICYYSLSDSSTTLFPTRGLRNSAGSVARRGFGFEGDGGAPGSPGSPSSSASSSSYSPPSAQPSSQSKELGSSLFFSPDGEVAYSFRAPLWGDPLGSCIPPP